MSNLSHEKTQDIVIQQIEEALETTWDGKINALNWTNFIDSPEWLRYTLEVIDTYAKALIVKDNSIRTLEDTIKRLTDDLKTHREISDGRLEQGLKWMDEASRLTSLLRQKEDENKRLQSLIRPPSLRD